MCTYKELSTVYTVPDVFDMLEILDIKEEIDAVAYEEQEKKIKIQQQNAAKK